MIEMRDDVAEMLDGEFGLDVTVGDRKVVGERAGRDVIVVEWDERGEWKITAETQGVRFVWEQDDEADETVTMFTHMAMQDAE